MFYLCDVHHHDDGGVLASSCVGLPPMTHAWLTQTIVGIAVKSTSYSLHDDRAKRTETWLPVITSTSAAGERNNSIQQRWQNENSAISRSSCEQTGRL